MSDEKRKLFNLDQVARIEIIGTLSKEMMENIKTCKTAKDMWDKLALLCEGMDQTKENKLQLVLHLFDTLKMKLDESVDQLDMRLTNILNKASSLGKKYTEKEIANKVLKSLTSRWRVKVTVIKDNKDLNTLNHLNLLDHLKAHEFDL